MKKVIIVIDIRNRTEPLQDIILFILETLQCSFWPCIIIVVLPNTEHFSRPKKVILQIF